MRLAGGLGVIVCTGALLVDLISYINLSRLGGAAPPDTLRTLFWGMVLFPIGVVLSLVLLRRSKK